MLAASVDALKGLFMKQTCKSVLLGNFLHQFHGDLVVIGCYIGAGENRCKLVLRGRNFVVLRFCKNSELPKLQIQFFHKLMYPRFDDAEIVIVQFLPTRRFGTEQCPPGQHQIRTLGVEFLVNQEIFLFRTDRWGNARDAFALREKAKYA